MICTLTVISIGASIGARAQSCSFSVTNLDFGTVDLTTGTPFTTTGTFSATCTGTPNDEIRACPNFGAGTGGVASGGDPRYMLNGANQLQYNIFKKSNFSDVWGSHLWPYAPLPPELKIKLDNTGAGSAARTIYAEIYGSQATLPVGPYISLFSGADSLISYAYESFVNCTTIGSMNGVSVPFVVQAANISSCLVSASTLDFGTAGALTSNVDTTNSIDVTCTLGTTYQIGLSGGNAAAADPTQRKMSFGATDITYGIYSNAAYTLPWGDTLGTNTVAGTATGTVQSYTAYGRVPVQPTPLPGTYTDSIVVTVTY